MALSSKDLLSRHLRCKESRLYTDADLWLPSFLKISSQPGGVLIIARSQSGTKWIKDVKGISSLKLKICSESVPHLWRFESDAFWKTTKVQVVVGI